MGVDTSTSVVRADALTTKRSALALFARTGSGRVFVSGVVALGCVRLVVGGIGIVDAVVAAASVALVGPVEWLLHALVLHARDDSWSTRRLGAGSGHRRHHQDPPDLEWLLLGGPEALVATLAFGALGGAAVGVVSAVWDTATLGPWFTAWLVASAALAHYEWSHLLFHTRYRCRTRYYRRLAANHRRHHYRNERYWLGVTTNTGDRLARTIPSSPATVPSSATARSLDDSY